MLRVIADGGMGLVFEAHHELLGKSVALKFPLPELAQVPSVAERFLSEARLCARIENEHVVRILDAARLNGLPYIVMEFLKGTTLSGLLGRRWDRARAAAFARQLLDGLGAVHALGVVHRDVKPDNVLVVQSTRGSVLKLVDFGIAKDSIPRETIKHLTRAGVMLGTPAYMAPEQIRDPLHADLRADLYSVGILLFEMLSGSSPFTGRTVQELADEALVGKLRSLLDLAPDTPQSLVEIVSRATAVEPAKRFQTAAEFGGALAPFASGWLDEPPGDAGQTIADRHAPWTEPGTQGVTTHTERGSTVGQAPVTRTDGAPAPPVATKHLAGVGQGSSARRPRRTRYVRGLAGLALAVAALIVLVAFIAARRKAREESERDALSPTLVSKAPATLEVAPIAPEELPALAETSGEPAQPVPLKPAAANVKRDGASPA
ncbi:MAG: protein kinase, partial [Myxococcales bacterium]